jgi:predicted RNA-binding protein with PUA-like domain
MAARYFLVKSEPTVYGFDLVLDGRTRWDGVRNFEARNNLRAMKLGDLAFFYHSSVGLEIVGVVRVVKEAYPDPSADSGDWSAVDLAPVAGFTRRVSLAEMKADPALAELSLVKKPRISVVPIDPAHWKRLLALGKTKLPKG